jgi:hypothetical protein
VVDVVLVDKLVGRSGGDKSVDVDDVVTLLVSLLVSLVVSLVAVAVLDVDVTVGTVSIDVVVNVVECVVIVIVTMWAPETSVRANLCSWRGQLTSTINTIIARNTTTTSERRRTARVSLPARPNCPRAVLASRTTPYTPGVNNHASLLCPAAVIRSIDRCTSISPRRTLKVLPDERRETKTRESLKTRCKRRVERV